MFSSCAAAMATIRKLGYGDTMCAVPTHRDDHGWRVERLDRQPLTQAQRERIEAHEHDPEPVKRTKPVKAKVVKTEPAVRPVATGERTKRVAGVADICKALMTDAMRNDKPAFVAACIERGIHPSTASTQWYRHRKG